VGLLLLAGALAVSLGEWTARSRVEPVEWDLVLTGRDGQELTLSYDEVLALPGIETTGGFFSSVGTVYGPYALKGVRLETLLDLVGGMDPSDILMVGAQDGYSSVFDNGQVRGEIDAFEPGTLRLVPQGEIEFVLIYEQDGSPLSHQDGRPLRLAIISRDGLLTEGHWWVKWVNRLQVRSLTPAAGAER
jgi:DMSO/TMAO reductase YedYZ molybdopterin-dependent catalytic subunit